MTNLLDLYNTCGGIVCTDSRTITPGCLFFCLKGNSFDAHDFVNDIITRGARAVVVSDDKFSDIEKCFKVDDTLQALQDLAREYRKEFTIPVIAIGGSNGKTTTKELVKAVLDTKYNVHATKTNLNNHIGVPLTILSMSKATEIAVIEVGANHIGEHVVLLDIVQPTHVLVTNNGKDHLEGFGSLEGVKKANGELYDYAKIHDAIAFVPEYEEDLLAQGKDLHKISVGGEFQSKSQLYAGVVYKDVEVHSHLFGDFNEKNIMCALTVGNTFACELEKMKFAIEHYHPEILRSQIQEVDGIRYMIDCYNANPTSMEEALKNFKKYSHAPHAVVLGDMLEMGDFAHDEHAHIAELVSGYDFTVNIFVGENFRELREKYVGKDNFHFFEEVGEAKQFLAGMDLKGWDILLKGSKGVRIREIVGL